MAHLARESDSTTDGEERGVFASSFIQPCAGETSVKVVKNVLSRLQPTV